MSQLTTKQDRLPEVHVPPDLLMKYLSRMELLTVVSRWAMTAGSDILIQAVLELLAALEKAERLRQSYYSGDVPPEVEESYHTLTDNFRAFMQSIPQEAYEQLLEELRRIAADVGNGSLSLLDKVRHLLGG